MVPRSAFLLQLQDGPPGFDRVVLALIADKDDPFDALFPRLMQESVDLARGQQARFVDDPERANSDIRGSTIFKQRGHGASSDPSLFECPDGASSRTKAFDPVTARGGELAQRADRSGLGCSRPALDINRAGRS